MFGNSAFPFANLYYRLLDNCPNLMAAFRARLDPSWDVVILVLQCCLVLLISLSFLLDRYGDPTLIVLFKQRDQEHVSNAYFMATISAIVLLMTLFVLHRFGVWELYKLGTQSNEVKTEVLEKVQAERDQLKKENERLASKCEKALATARQKRAQLDTVTREIASLKEDFETARTDLPEKFVAEKQKQVRDEPFYAEEEELLLCSAWESFKTKFKIVQDTVTNLLQNSISVRNSSVRATNMALVREMSDLMEGIRNHFLSTTEECTEKLEDVLGLATPLPAKIENEGLDSQLLD